jgi:formyl-CoA transferase
MLLADMGADVIKVEPPWGEPWRLNQQFMPLESRTFISLNRGKRSLPLDLTKPEAREIAHKLARQVDVVIVNFRPDVPAKLGIDYETLSALNPRLIYCENTAFGSRGPHSHRPGYDIIAQAMTGLMAAEGKVRDGVPEQIVSTAVADYSTGITIAWGVCAALFHRERTGRGQKLETTLLGTALGVQTSRMLLVESLEGETRRALLEELAHLRAAGASYEEQQEHYQKSRNRPPGNIYYRTYQTRDGHMAVGCLSEPLRKRLADVLGLHDIRFEPGYNAKTPEARAFGDELTKKAEALFLQKTTEEWLRVLDEARIPAGPVMFSEELLEDPQVLANGLVTELEHSKAGKITMVAPFLTMSETPLESRMASPALGEHTEAILGGLGYGAAEVAALREKGVTR